MLKQDLLEEFRQGRHHYEALGQVLQGHLEGLLIQAGITVHDVSHRVKKADSLARKLARPDRIYRRLDDITDLVGVRVITFFEDSLEQVARLVEERFRVDMDRSEDKRLRQGPNHFGYRSVHYICHTPRALLEDFPDISFEIQIRTILQHAWAEIEHDLGYKSPEAIPQPVRRRFSRLAGLLEIADSEFVALRRFMEDYARDLQRPEHLRGTEGLDKVSLQSLTESTLVASLDASLARHLDKELASTVFYPDYLTRMLLAASLDTPARVLRHLDSFSPRLLDFAERYFRFTQQTWGLDSAKLASVERGYSLLLLAHGHTLEQADLELHRIERMKAFYQQLDYPTEEEEARRIARLFVKSFTDWRSRP